MIDSRMHSEPSCPELPGPMRVARISLSIAYAVTVLAAAVTACPALAEYPDKPVKVIVPYQPGGATDLVARLVAQKLSEEFKQSVVVENRPGAGGMTGESTVAKAAPDGYTVLINATGVVLNASPYRKPLYDPKELQPVAQLMNVTIRHRDEPSSADPSY